MKKMNVYEKLAKARVAFMQGNVKKNGKNDFAKYTYFELSDILPVINKIAEEIKFTTVVLFNKEVAVLRFIDTEKPEDYIEFSSPMSEANLKGAHPVQNLGAVETYIKRYLYQNCFEIAENDSLDGTMNPNEKASSKSPNKWTKEQMSEIGNILNSTSPNGSAVFTEQEKQNYRNMIGSGQDFNLTITRAKNELQEKLAKASQETPEDLF
jgi:hypothetical protein